MGEKYKNLLNINDKNIIFELNKINYVRVSIEFINDYLKMVNNPEISKFISTKDKKYTYEDELCWINKKLEEKAFVFSMIDKNTNKFIGNIELINLKDDSVEIAICITEEFQNKHYGTEALSTIIDMCFNKFKLKELNLSVFSNNVRAIHCYKKLGFKAVDIDKNISIRDGKNIDDIYMKLQNKDKY